MLVNNTVKILKLMSKP